MAARSPAAFDALEKALHDERAATHAFLVVRHANLLASLRDTAAGQGRAEEPVPESGGSWQHFAPSSPPPGQQQQQENAACEALQTSEGGPSGASEGASRKKLRASRTSRNSLGEPPTAGPSSKSVGALSRFTSAKKPGLKKKEAEESKGSMHRMVTHPVFEAGFIVLIVCNALVMAAEAQYNGLAMGFAMEYPKYDRDAAASWPHAEASFEMIGLLFGSVFTVELVLKMVGLRLEFLLSLWNWFDFVVITIWLLTEAIQLDIGLNPMVFRLFRLAKLVRMTRVLRFVKALDALQLIVSSILASGAILIWSTLILIMGFMTCAIGLNFMLADYMNDPTNHNVDVVYRYFGTFTRSMLTMFEITLGNWIPACRTLMETVSEWYMLFFLLYKLTVGFAVIKVITGVFMHETFKVAENDDELMIAMKERLVKKHTQKMNLLFAELDDSGDGLLTIEEFRDVVNDRRVKLWLGAMELDVQDADTLFELMDHPDDGESQLSAEELVAGVGHLKGTARRLDMEVLHRDLKEMKKIFLQAHVPETRAELASLRKDTQSLCGYVLRLEAGLADGSGLVVSGNSRGLPTPEGAERMPATHSRERREGRSRSPGFHSRSPGCDPSDVAKRIGRRRSPSPPSAMVPLTAAEGHLASVGAVRLLESCDSPPIEVYTYDDESL